MADIVCPTCNQTSSDEELFCTHCGAASVPQMSKEELNRLMWQQSRPRQPIIGGLIGLCIVPASYALGSIPGWLSWNEIKAPTRFAAFLMAWILIGACGALVGFILDSRRRPPSSKG